MGLLNLIARVWTPSAREEALDRVVRRSTPLVVDLVDRAPLAMCTAEARGYIRAQAIGETRRQVALVIDEFPKLQAQRAKLLQDALEHVTRAVLAQVREQLRNRFVLRKAA